MDIGAATALGVEPVWYSDIDPPAQKVFEHHWPGVPNLGDVRTIDWESVEPVDVLSAGYPCQPFSVAGNRKGTTDERHLWPHIARGIRLLRPGIVILENVPGHRMRGFGEVLGDLAALGYRIAWGSVRASDVGGAHRRERLFVVAANADGQHRIQRRAATTRAAKGKRTVREPGGRDGVPADTDRARLERPQPAGRRTVSSRRAAADPASVGRLQGKPEPTRKWRGPDVADRDSHPVDWGRYGDAVRRWERVLGRPAPHPITFGPRGGKKVSPPFGEWLMGFDAGHISGVPGFTLNEALKLIGNAVMPQQAAYAISLLLPLLIEDRKEA